MSFLADSDASALPAPVKAGLLKDLERADALETIARAHLVRSFDLNDDYESYGQRSMSAWLVNEAGLTKAEAGAYRKWTRTVLASEIRDRAPAEDPRDDDPDRGFQDRSLRLELTLDGAGTLTGQLSPECAAAVGSLMRRFAARRGNQDTRSQLQHNHDALMEICPPSPGYAGWATT